MSPESQNALADVQRILQDDYPEVDAVRMSRVEARIRGEIKDTKKAWWLPLGLTTAVAAAVALFVVNADEPKGDYNERGVIAWDASSPKQPNLNTALSKQPAQLAQGELQFEVNRLAEMKAFMLQTPHVGLAVKEARFSVVVDAEATRLAVEAGRVDVRTAPDRPWRSAMAKEVFRKDQPKAVHTVLPAAAVTKTEAVTTPVVRMEPEPARHRAMKPTRPEQIAEDSTPAIPRRSVAPKPRPVAPTPTPRLEPSDNNISAWMSAADAARRQGQPAEALALYKKVAQARDDAGLKEEATLRWAQTAARTGHRREALHALARYTKAGPLLPERIALQARLHLENGRGDKAARLISRQAPRPLALVVAEVAVAVAEADANPSQVVDLCLLVRASASSTPSLKDRARAVELRASEKEMIDQ